MWDTLTYSASSPTGRSANNTGVTATGDASLSWAADDFGHFVHARRPACYDLTRCRKSEPRRRTAGRCGPVTKVIRRPGSPAAG
ncbi:hypothetical protein JOF56_000460 [Kibdelosporangium banguiense]|uniref:Uncharacterized protein n=1 Tax=Kibdelosporangium banguiense TaxID=1365924 RepID=A0ABS4T7I3_9PSEU|nr:hypothetical protein [Kibdelosporangium banguiense]